MMTQNLELAGTSVIVLASSIISGLTGFGFGLVTIPLLMIWFSPKLIVPVSILLGLISRLVLGIELKQEIDLRRLWPLAATGAIGAVAGALILSILDTGALKLVIGSVIIV